MARQAFPIKAGPLFTYAEAATAGPTIVGGKGWNLGRLARYGFTVPVGAVLAAEAYREHLSDAGIGAHLAAVANVLATATDAPETIAHLDAIRAAIMGTPLSTSVVEAVRDFLDEHGLVDDLEPSVELVQELDVDRSGLIAWHALAHQPGAGHDRGPPDAGPTVDEDRSVGRNLSVDGAQRVGDLVRARGLVVRAADVVEPESHSLAGEPLPLGRIGGHEPTVQRPLALGFLAQRDHALDAFGGQRLEGIVVQRRLLAARDPSSLEPAEVPDAAELPHLNQFGPPPRFRSAEIVPRMAA